MSTQIEMIIHGLRLHGEDVFALVTIADSRPGQKFWMTHDTLTQKYQKYIKFLKIKPYWQNADMSVEQQALMMLLTELAETSELNRARKN